MARAEHTEVEIKLYVPDLRPVVAHLMAAGATLAHPRVYERNVRYEDAGGTLAPRGMALRLRQDDRVRLTYKGPPQEVRTGSGVRRRFEAEVTVDDFDAMHAILGGLGYTTALVYEKHRTTYMLDGAEIVLDELPYGQFVEVEADDEDAVDTIVARIGLADAPRMAGSYTLLFQFVKAHLGLAMRDLTFEAFANVNVPLSAFAPPTNDTPTAADG